MTTALAATVGTGNIAGVAGAIALGGPGAVFWMWVSAFLGMATKYAEVVLAVRYRQRAADGIFYGGPMYYIRALGRGFAPLARIFALLGALAAFGIGNMVQANTAAEAAAFSLTALFPALTEAPLRLFVGLLLSLTVALALAGGAARIGRATERLVPLMSALYACMALAVVFLRFPAAVRALGDIVTAAFSPARGSRRRGGRRPSNGAALRHGARHVLPRGGHGLRAHRPRGRADGRPRPAGPFRHLRGLCRHHRHLHLDGAGHPRKRRSRALWTRGGRGTDHRRYGNGLWRRPCRVF